MTSIIGNTNFGEGRESRGDVDIWVHCLTTWLSLCLPLKDSEKLMEQQGALLKRLAEADSEKAVTQRPLPALVAYRRQCARGAGPTQQR